MLPDGYHESVNAVSDYQLSTSASFFRSDIKPASAKHCREDLRELTDLTYLSTDVRSVMVLHEQLQVALRTLKWSIHQAAVLL